MSLQAPRAFYNSINIIFNIIYRDIESKPNNITWAVGYIITRPRLVIAYNHILELSLTIVTVFLNLCTAVYLIKK